MSSKFISTKDYVLMVEKGVTAYVDGELINAPYEVTYSTERVEFHAPKGFEFEELYIIDEVGYSIRVDYNDDRTVGVLNYSYLPDEIMDIVLREAFNTDVISALNNVYLLNDEQLVAFSEESLNILTIDPDGLGVRDFSSFIVNCLRLPFNIDDGMVVGSEAIRLGKKTLEVEAPVLSSDVFNLSLGTVHVPKGDTFLDYQTAKCVLRLPFSDNVELPVDYVIGYDISVNYRVNLYTGETVVNVSSSGFEEFIYSSIVKMGTTVPTANYKRVPELVVDSSIELGVDNGRDRFSIEILKNLEALPNNEFSIPVKDYGKLDGLTGYVTVENIELKGNISSSERDSLIGLLNSGVFIND